MPSVPAAAVAANRPAPGAPGDRAVTPVAAVPAGKIGMWVFLATDAMGFAGLLLAHAMLRVRDATWADPAARFDCPLAGALTLALLISGATMAASSGAARAGRWATARRLAAVTAALGALFALGQVIEFRSLVVARHVGLTSDHAAGLFFVIAGYHGLHVLIGVAVLAGVVLRGGDAGLAGPAAADRRGRWVVALDVAALYWQFVDVAWIVIFTVIYLLPVAHGG